MRIKILIATAFFLIAVLGAGFLVSDSTVIAPVGSEQASLHAPPALLPAAESSGITEIQAPAPPETPAQEVRGAVTEPGKPDPEESDEEPEEAEQPNPLVTLTISAAGDVTLGGDPRGSHFFLNEFRRHDQDHGHFLKDFRHIFEEDDLTIVNLEGTLTDVELHRDRTFVFKGPPHLARVLSSSGVEAVSLANNHTMDFLAEGYQDTKEALDVENIIWFGNESNAITEIKGISVGMFGFLAWSGTRNIEKLVSAAIDDLRDRGAQLIIAYFHWGSEYATMPNNSQRAIARYAIDNGADLVLGAHPHVMQGIEVYNGKNIVYSLGNFCFGGNSNPADKDTFVFQQTFTFYDGQLLETNETNIIPALISSKRGRNDFQPTIARGDDAERILERLEMYSSWLT